MEELFGSGISRRVTSHSPRSMATPTTTIHSAAFWRLLAKSPAAFRLLTEVAMEAQ